MGDAMLSHKTVRKDIKFLQWLFWLFDLALRKRLSDVDDDSDGNIQRFVFIW